MFACEIGHFRKDTAGFLPDSPKVKQCEDMSAVVAEDGSIGSLTFVSLNSRLESNKAEEENFRGAGVPGTMTLHRVTRMLGPLGQILDTVRAPYSTTSGCDCVKLRL